MKPFRILFRCPEGHGRVLFDPEVQVESPTCPAIGCGREMEQAAIGPQLLDVHLPGDLREAHVLLGFTQRTPTPSTGFALALARTQPVLARAGIALTVRPVVGGSIQVARDRMSATVLRHHPEATHLAMVDDDLEWDPADLVRAVRSGLDVVGGIYATRTLNWESVKEAIAKDRDPSRYASPLRSLPLVKNERGGFCPDPSGQYLEAEGVPAGFLVIRRAVLERMTDAYETKFDAERIARGETPEAGFWPLANPAEPGHSFWSADDRMVVTRIFPDQVKPLGKDPRPQYWSEDYTFCDLWRALGGKVYADAVAAFGHQGMLTFKTAPLVEVYGAAPVASSPAPATSP